MASEPQQQGSVLPLLLIIAAIWFFTQGPKPEPPKPVDPVTPVVPVDPQPVPVTSFRVIFVKESGSTLPAEQTAIPGAKAIREYLNAKTTREGNQAGWREYDPQQTTAGEQQTMAEMWSVVKSQINVVPCLVVQVNGKITVLNYPKNADEALKTLQQYGGPV